MNKMQKQIMAGGAIVIAAAAVYAFVSYQPEVAEVSPIDETARAHAADAENAESALGQAVNTVGLTVKTKGKAKIATKKTTTVAGASNKTTTSAGRGPASVARDAVYVVQVGAFHVKENADHLLEQLKTAGFTAEVRTVNHSKNGLLHLVRLLPSQDRSSAEAEAASLKQKTSLTASVVREPAGI